MADFGPGAASANSDAPAAPDSFAARPAPEVILISERLIDVPPDLSAERWRRGGTMMVLRMLIFLCVMLVIFGVSLLRRGMRVPPTAVLGGMALPFAVAVPVILLVSLGQRRKLARWDAIVRMLRTQPRERLETATMADASEKHLQKRNQRTRIRVWTLVAVFAGLFFVIQWSAALVPWPMPLLFFIAWGTFGLFGVLFLLRGRANRSSATAQTRILSLSNDTAASPERARVVVLGTPRSPALASDWRPSRPSRALDEMLQPPEVGELYFEPEILTSLELEARRFMMIPMFVILVGLLLLNRFGVAPAATGAMPRFTYLWVIAGVGLATLAWKGFVRPTYIRLAPGSVEILRYKWPWTRAPEISAFRMTAGTTVIIHRGVNAPSITLARDRFGFFSLARVRKPQEKMEKIWNALLSTAPTPPLSQTGLTD